MSGRSGFASAVRLLALLCALLFSSKGEAAKPARPKLHLICPQTCFEDYLRQELSYFDVVRDRYQSDLTLLIVRQKAANGGERMSVRVLPPEHGVPEHSTVSQPAASAEQTRRQLLQEVLAALYGALSDTPHRAAFQLSLPQRLDGSLSRVDDAWDHWVVSPEQKGVVDAESNFHFVELHSALTFRRVTEQHRLRLRGTYSRSFSRFVLEDGSELTGGAYEWSGRVSYARTVGQRWALGFAATERSSKFENLRGHAHGGAVAEVNLFPYTENVNKQVRVAYQAGPWLDWYFEPTRDGVLHRVRPYQAVTLVADANQRWGSLQWAFQFNSLLDEPAKWRLGTAAIASLRLFEGLAFNLMGQAALVRDQLSLRARPLTDTDLLLGNVQQETNFKVQLEFGLSYTFGSVHDTIVNPRFGRLDLEED